MSRTGMVILEQDHDRFVAILEELNRESNARLAVLLAKSGQTIACHGDLNGVDATSLASLAAGNVAATEGLVRLLGESHFCTLFHEGRQDSLHITLISNKVILLVIFDEHSSLGLVRLRVEQFGPQLKSVVDEILERGDNAGEMAAAEMSLGDLSDEDIDALFA
jgi:predicted regulator of Ras-like GTPase activity (Roadblock/LC7/MglB family)